MMQHQVKHTIVGSNRTGSTADPHAIRRGPLHALYNLFSNVWLGVILLTLLFIYSSIGSAYPPFRQLRIFEMTEFEWFHYWPFNTLIAMICLNIIVTTLRRIRFKPVNYGVWMIHSGILILCASSVWYFGTKVEGEAIVPRRNVTLSLPGVDPVTFVARPGNVASIESDSARYFVQVASIDPSWELLSGDDKGKKTYAVTLNIQRATADSDEIANADPTNKFGQTFSFMRQIIAGFPQYTEDILRTDDHTQPMKRAKKVNADGNPLVDETFAASLDYSPESYFYLVSSAALYLREVAPDGKPMTDWIERPISKIPRYHDYISDRASIWPASDDPNPPMFPLNIKVSENDKNSNDPLAGNVVITDFLRYAMMDTRRMPGGEKLDPAVSVELSAADGRSAIYEMVALDTRRSMVENGRLLFMWAETTEELNALRNAPGPRLAVRFPDTDIETTIDITASLDRQPDAPFVPIAGSGFSVRAERMENNLLLQDGTTFSIAVLQVRRPDGTEIRRVVHADPAQPNVDFPLEQVVTGHEQPLPLDETVAMTYLPSPRPALVTIVAGPEEDALHVVHSPDSTATVVESIKEGDLITIDANLSMKVIRYAARTRTETRPAIIPNRRRDRNVGEQFSMIRATVPVQSKGASNVVQSVWLPFHLFPFENDKLVLRRFRYEPKRVVIDDKGTVDPGDDRTVEILFSRQRLPLPVPVVLDDFILTTHTGGYTSDAAIRNWTSVVRFASVSENNSKSAADARWAEPLSVSVNEPVERDGFWFFQSRWDPPDPPIGPNDSGSAGFNHTVLGVGNRKGVNVMLAGCCVAVLGMIYAFYIKPHIKRRQLLLAHSMAEAHAATLAQTNGELALNPDDVGQTLEPAELNSPRMESRS